jgi:hypothetical protein
MGQVSSTVGRGAPGRTRTGRTGDSVTGGGPSTTFRRRHRGPRSLPGCTPSRWGRTGTGTGGRQTHAGRRRSPATSATAIWFDFRQQIDRGLTQLIERQCGRCMAAADQQQAGWQLERRQDRTQPTPQAIAGHRRTEGARQCERHQRGRCGRIGTPGTPESGAADPCALALQAQERVSAADPTDQADRRARPLARRLFSTARPARVDIRARKPCFFARRWLLG